MGVFDINYKDFVTDYVPVDKREPVNISFLTALLKPLETLHVSTFTTFKPDITDRAKQNGQRILVESILNTFFGIVAAPFIYIDNNGDNITPDILFNISEGLPPFTLYNVSEAVTPEEYFFNETEITNNKSFVVYVPTADLATHGEPAIRQQVDRLRPYSTFYTVLSY